MPQRVYTADGRSFVATDRYGRADQRRCQQYLDPGACHSSGCQTSGQRCHSATTPIVNPTPMMAQCATISPTSHRAGWAAACRAAGCRVDRGMACVPRLRLTPKSSSRRRLPQARGTHATNTPRVFIRGKGEALLLKIDQNINTGAQRYTVRYAAEPQETVVIDQSQIRRLKWGLYGRLKLRPFPRVMGEEPCSYYGRRLLYDQSHSSEEVQRCLARLCAREDADNAFCAYGEGRGRVIPPGGVDAVVRGIGRVLAKFCEESPAALESEICQVYRQLTRACSEDDESTVFAPADRCHKRAKDKTKDLDKDLAAVDLPKLFGQEKEEVGAYLEARNTTAKTRDAAPDVSVVRDRTACRKACAATKARATCGGKAEAACRAWSECDWNTGEDACYGKAELACYRGCADVAAKAAAAGAQAREDDRTARETREDARNDSPRQEIIQTPNTAEPVAPPAAADLVVRLEDERKKLLNTTNTATSCADLKSENACTAQDACEWQVGRGYFGDACANKGTRNRVTTSRTVTKDKKLRELDSQIAEAKLRQVEEKNKEQACSDTCDCTDAKLCREHARCGWVASKKKCDTKEEWKRQANEFEFEFGLKGSREEMCAAAGGAWKGGWRGLETGGECT